MLFGGAAVWLLYNQMRSSRYSIFKDHWDGNYGDLSMAQPQPFPDNTGGTQIPPPLLPNPGYKPYAGSPGDNILSTPIPEPQGPNIYITPSTPEDPMGHIYPNPSNATVSPLLAVMSENKNGTLSGTPAKIYPNDDTETIRGRTRENESAQILANNGYNVHQSPTVPGPSNPDYLVNGDVFDNYAPKTGNVTNIVSNISDKVGSGQAPNIVLNLNDSTATIDDVMSHVDRYPVDGLRTLIVIDKFGRIVVKRGR